METESNKKKTVEASLSQVICGMDQWVKRGLSCQTIATLHCRSAFPVGWGGGAGCLYELTYGLDKGVMRKVWLTEREGCRVGMNGEAGEVRGALDSLSALGCPVRGLCLSFCPADAHCIWRQLRRMIAPGSACEEGRHSAAPRMVCLPPARSNS